MADPTERKSPYRLTAPKNPITITLDGEPVLAERGEPVAAALVAGDKLTVARSPKFHRPRGPSCFRAACDGCLARVNDDPNMMTCMVPAEEGMTVVTQNRLGPREADFLRMTDWFFPDGMNHHEIFAGIPGVQNVMQMFARRVAGLGKLPAETLAPRKAQRRDIDAVVVGSGPSGMAIAVELVRAGRSVEIIDDQIVHGGGLEALEGTAKNAFAALRRSFDEAVARGSVRLRTRTVAGAIYGRDLLVVGDEGAELVRARDVVFACGGHDGVLAFEGNDMPGIMSARAAGFLLSRGILAGKNPVVVIADGGGPFGEAYASAFERATSELGSDVSVEIVRGEPLRARGQNRVKDVLVRTPNGDREFITDAVLVDAARSPAYELAAQAGATVKHEPRGFVVQTDRGRIAEGIWAVGELVGVPFEASAILADAKRTAEHIAAT